MNKVKSGSIEEAERVDTFVFFSRVESEIVLVVGVFAAPSKLGSSMTPEAFEYIEGIDNTKAPLLLTESLFAMKSEGIIRMIKAKAPVANKVLALDFNSNFVDGTSDGALSLDASIEIVFDIVLG